MKLHCLYPSTAPGLAEIADRIARAIEADPLAIETILRQQARDAADRAAFGRFLVRALHPGTKRWQLSAAIQAAQQPRQAAMAQIAALEASQPRAVREAVLGLPGALERLRSIDAQIAALRPALAP